jgi:RNA recognition motif-containing protein
MRIFIRLLPESVTQSDLRRFVEKAIHSPWQPLLLRRSKIHSTEIRMLVNRATGSVEYHGLVDVEPAKRAAVAIRKLNQTPLKGKAVEVRKYYERSALRDRRGGDMAAASSNRRKRDRRRENLVAESVNISGPLRAGRLQASHISPEILRIIN